MSMKQSYRESMRWLHTWSGLILGWLLFAIFVTGTTSYYKDEINLWMKPEFHASQVSQKTMRIAIDKAIATTQKSDNVTVTLPDSRSNLIAIRAEKSSTKNTSAQKGAHGHNHGDRAEKAKAQTKTQEQKTTQNTQKNKRSKKRRTPSTYYDATTGELIKETTKTAGGDFLYRFHFELYGMPKMTGRWIVGIATMLMLVAIISGIIIHKRIFKDVFTFRPKNNPRGWMDAHILPAVAALPFLIMITYSGLVLFTNIMFPYGMKAYYGDNFMKYRQDMMAVYKQSDTQKTPKLQKEQTTTLQENKNIHRIVTANALRDINRHTNNSAHRIINANAIRVIKINSSDKQSTLSKEKLKAILTKAQKIWPENIGGFSIVKKADTTLVQITPKDPSTLFNSRVTQESITFDIKTMQMINQITPPIVDSVVLNTSSALRSLHEAKFADSTLRFIFFLSGVIGIILSGTGLILWIEKRKKKNVEKKSVGFWLVEKLNLGTIMGIFIAIAVFFIANRLIVVEESVRRVVEINIFFIAWLLSYIYAFFRDTAKAWKEQLLIASILFILVPVINAVTVFESFAQIFSRDNIFIYFDFCCIFMGLVFIMIRAILIKKEKRKGEEK